MRRTSQKDATNSNLEDQTLDWGKAVGGPRQDLGSLILPFNDGHDPKPMFKHFPGEEEKSSSFSVGGAKPPWHTRDAAQHLQDKKGLCTALLLLVFLQLMALPTPVQEFLCLLNPARALLNALVPRAEPGWRRSPSWGVPGFWPRVSALSTLPRCHRGAGQPQIADMTPNPSSCKGRQRQGRVFWGPSLSAAVKI